MSSESPVLSHITRGADDYDRANRFYDAVLAPLGFDRIPKPAGKLPLCAKGQQMPQLYSYKPIDGRPATWGNGTHAAFLAGTTQAVDAFHSAALTHGGMDEGPSGICEHYGPDYHAAYVRHPDGNKLQAICYT